MIEYKNIGLKFDDRIIFSHFNLEIKENEKVLLLAPSGRGKTTLIKMLMGFQKPDTGEILVNGQKMTRETINVMRQTISYVSQDADIPKGIVEHVFKEVFEFHANREISYSKEVLIKWLKEFDLREDIIDKEVDQLSGGERQRLALIMGILLNRKIWILDEITTGLDQELKKKIISVLLDYKKTMVIISHDDIFKNCGLKEVTW